MNAHVSPPAALSQDWDTLDQGKFADEAHTVGGLLARMPLDDAERAAVLAGAIGLVERYRDDRQIHVIRNWCYLGSVSNVAQAGALDVRAAAFDADGYKMPCQPLLSGGAEIILLRAGKGALSCTPWSMATTSL